MIKRYDEGGNKYTEHASQINFGVNEYGCVLVHLVELCELEEKTEALEAENKAMREWIKGIIELIETTFDTVPDSAQKVREELISFGGKLDVIVPEAKEILGGEHGR